ncbi:MAG: NAD-glutamate dehydrogenase domain-containing protein [Acetobacteraceae bacterium]
MSKGGGVFERSAKSIALSPEARALLGIAAPSAPPQEIIRARQRMPVDLRWNGGLGTYVTASSEPPSAATGVPRVRRGPAGLASASRSPVPRRRRAPPRSAPPARIHGAGTRS